MIGAIVLAAGRSERMGRPKALIHFRGMTFLERIAGAIRESCVGHTVVVTGHHRQAIEAMETAIPLPEIVFNPRYDEGMCTSVQEGIRSLPAGITGAMIFLVDHPLVDAGTINALAERIRPGCIVLPVHDGKRGHPVLFAAQLFDEILAIPSGSGLNTVVRQDPARVIEVPVEAPGILCDIDTPEQLAKLLDEEGGHDVSK